jgi:hypothetical protein
MAKEISLQAIQEGKEFTLEVILTLSQYVEFLSFLSFSLSDVAEVHL